MEYSRRDIDIEGTFLAGEASTFHHDSSMTRSPLQRFRVHEPIRPQSGYLNFEIPMGGSSVARALQESAISTQCESLGTRNNSVTDTPRISRRLIDVNIYPFVSNLWSSRLGLASKEKGVPRERASYLQQANQSKLVPTGIRNIPLPLIRVILTFTLETEIIFGWSKNFDIFVEFL